MNKKIIREKRHRLDAEVYKGGIVVTFTICIKDRKSFFVNKDIFKMFQEILLNELKEFNCSAFVYLFMPEHAHLTLTGNDEKSELKECIDMFKQKTGYWLSKNHPEIKW